MEMILIVELITLCLAGMLYCIIILVFTWGWFKLFQGCQEKANSQNALRISVIVPARNEEDHMIDLLKDMEHQDYPSSGYEVIIVDDQSSDRTAEVVQRFIQDHPWIDIKLIRNDDHKLSGSKKEALAAGISAASGELILTTDADCRFGRRWISAMSSFFNDDVELVAGPVSYIASRGILNQFQALEFLGMMAAGAGGVRAGLPFICNGANLAYRKRTFLALQGFTGNQHILSGDDVFLMHKVKRERGHCSIRFAGTPDALVRTTPVASLGAFIRQRIRWASKSTGYRDRTAMLTTLAVFLLNLAVVALFFTGFFHSPAFLVFVGAILTKSIIDLPLLLGVTKFTDQRWLLRSYLLFQLIYPFYVVTTGILSLWLPVYWKRQDGGF